MSKQVMLASKAEQPPESHRAWLGVMLSPADEDGVTVERVVPRSPAAKGGLKQGDVIVKLNDKAVKDVQSFVECVEDFRPDSRVSVVIQRDGNEQTLTVRLGDIEEAPMRFLREAMRNAMQGPDFFSPDVFSRRQSIASDPLMEETLDELRQRIRELEKQVERLQGDADKQPKPGAVSDDDLTEVEGDAGSTTLVVQRDRGRGRGYGRDGSDWRRYQGRNGYNWNRQRPWDRYGSGYGPMYRSPGYGHSYYRYGGRPYYYGNYGGRYGYGLRSGIQIGNLGVFWY